MNVAPADLIKNPIFSRGLRIKISVADSDPGPGAFLIRGCGSGFSGSRIPDPQPTFEEHSNNVLGNFFLLLSCCPVLILYKQQ